MRGFAGRRELFSGFRANPSPYYRFCLCCGRKSHPVDELSLPRTELSHRKTALAGETPNRFCVFGSDFVVSRLLGGFFCHKKAETSDLGRKRSHSCSAGQAERPDAKPRCGIPCLIWADGRSSCRASGGAACMQQRLAVAAEVAWVRNANGAADNDLIWPSARRIKRGGAQSSRRSLGESGCGSIWMSASLGRVMRGVVLSRSDALLLRSCAWQDAAGWAWIRLPLRGWARAGWTLLYIMVRVRLCLEAKWRNRSSWWDTATPITTR